MDGAYGVLFWIMHSEINFLTCIWKDASFASNVDSYTKGQDIKKVEMSESCFLSHQHKNKTRKENIFTKSLEVFISNAEKIKC